MNKDVVVSLFDLTGVMTKPWENAGYTCYIVDIQHPRGFAYTVYEANK